MSTTSSRVIIPNRYTKMHPIDPPEQRVDTTRPQDLEPRDTIRFILRDGQTGCCQAGAMWWGDRPDETSAIIAYKKIKLEKAWVEWGLKFDRDEELDTQGGVPAALNPTTRVMVWLRGHPSPQADSREARHWDWIVSGERGSDIMKYRIINN